jgi:putative two-component system response regulator
VSNRVLVRLIHRLRKCTPADRSFAMDLQLQVGQRTRWYRFLIHTLWATDNAREFSGIVGRLIDVDASYRQMEADKREVVQQALNLSLTYQRPNAEGDQVMTPAEVRVMIRYLQNVFDVVRLVDATANYEVTVLENGTVQEAPFHCFCIWGKGERCENCISAKCLCCQGRLEKFEFVEDKIYYVLALRVVIGGQAYALEMVSRVSDEAMLCGYGSDKLVDAIADHNKTLYIDPVTEVYNRRYYEEQLKELHHMEAVAMIDVDNFKQINDSYGHHVGDLALHDIAAAIHSCVRRSDVVVRYGGDEFVVVFRDIPREVFERKIQEMHDKMEQLRLADYPELRFALSIGTVYGQGRTADLVVQADEKMYAQKRAKSEE